jgi:hypothetical protein
MARQLGWFGVVLVACFLAAGCAGDEKGVNQDKDKPKPATKKEGAFLDRDPWKRALSPGLARLLRIQESSHFFRDGDGVCHKGQVPASGQTL